MHWGREEIDRVAVESATADFEAFESIGLEAIDKAVVLDIGCFDGFNTVLKFAPYENIRKVVGIDPEAEALALANKRTEDRRFTWIQAFAEQYDAPDASFDLVYLSHVFQHTKDKGAVAENAFRLLKPGGYIVIKTFDDSCKISYPDPNQIMRRLFSLYETSVLPYTEHTRYTDRNNGQKCPGYLSTAGFKDISVKIHTTDTLNKSVAERLALYDRFTYFRRITPKEMSPQLKNEYSELLRQWRDLFKKENYLHVSNTFIVTAKKPSENTCISNQTLPLNKTYIRDVLVEPMLETDLGQVMSIEIESFPDPWAPIAYAMEIRHNPNGFYYVARRADGTISGYVGWWVTGQGLATIMHIAVGKKYRKTGVGTTLLRFACDQAISCGCKVMQLQVRSKNLVARSFYEKSGFKKLDTNPDYYTNPKDNAILMCKSLDE